MLFLRCAADRRHVRLEDAVSREGIFDVYGGYFGGGAAFITTVLYELFANIRPR